MWVRVTEVLRCLDSVRIFHCLILTRKNTDRCPADLGVRSEKAYVVLKVVDKQCILAFIW